MPNVWRFVFVAALGVIPAAAQHGGLKLERSIPMPGVQGRIDHLAIDVAGERLFIAALGNNSLEVLDVKKQVRLHSAPGFSEPQGIAYVPSANRVYVANGGDGSVRILDGASFTMIRSVLFGDDADNVRLDASTGHLWVGYGSGALAEFDAGGAKLGEIKLDAHPESFQLEKGTSRVFINLPKSKKIAVADRKSRTVAGSWSTGGALANYPMALDEADHRLFVVTRSPARLIVLDASDGRQVAALASVGDCDDVFYDAKRHRIYAIGGEGGISVVQQSPGDQYKETARVATVAGARTGLFSPELDRLFVAVRAHGSQRAEVRVYTPVD